MGTDPLHTPLSSTNSPPIFTVKCFQILRYIEGGLPLPSSAFYTITGILL